MTATPRKISEMPPATVIADADLLPIVDVSESSVSSKNKKVTIAQILASLPDGAITSAKIADGAIVDADVNASAGIADTKLATIATAGKVSNSATTATNANTSGAIVARDASGNFSAGTITAALAGNASTVTTNANLTGDVTSVGNATSIAAGVVVDADVNVSAGIVASKLSFTQSGSGATARTIDSKLKDVVSVKDFGAVGNGAADDTAAFSTASALGVSVHVPAGTYLLNTSPTSSTATVYIIDGGASFTGAGSLPSTAKRIEMGAASTFVSSAANGIYSYLDANPTLNIRCSTSGVGISSAQQSSIGPGNAGEAYIGVAAFMHHNKAPSSSGVWGLYSTVLRDANAGGASHCLETDIFNKGSTVPLFPHAPIAAGQTHGLWIAAGGEYTEQSPPQAETGVASAGLVFLQNDGRVSKTACFEKGIVFHNRAILGTDGATGLGTAIALANRHMVQWFNNSGTCVGEINASANSASQPSRMSFSDFGILVDSRTNGNAALQIEVPPSATTGVAIQPNANAGSTPRIAALGSASDIDLWMAGKGNGLIRFGDVTGTTVTHTGYITIKDNSGNTVKLMVGT